MSLEHEGLMAFVDGELGAEEQARFRAHLAECDQCRRELAELMQLGALEDEARRTAGARVIPISRWRTPMIISVAAAALAASAAFAVFRTPPQVFGWTPGVSRSHDTWLSYPGVDGYRPYDALRAVDAPASDAVPLATLAALEERGDRHGLGVAWLLRKEPRRAIEALTAAQRSPAVDSDLAAAQLAAGDVKAALRTIDGVVERAPTFWAARFNRALIAERAGLLRVARAELEAIAEGTGSAAAPSGWREEARVRADALGAAQTDDEALQRAQDLLDVVVAGAELDASLVAKAPAHALEIYTLAVLGAQSAAELARLEPAARALQAALPRSGAMRHLELARRTPARFGVARWFRRLAVTLASLSPRADRLSFPSGVDGIEDASELMMAVLDRGSDDQQLAALFYYRERSKRAAIWDESAARADLPFFLCGAGWASFNYDWLGGRTADEGLLALDESVKACAEVDVERNAVRARHLRANVLFFARDLVRAEDAADRAREAARRLPDLRLEAQALEVSFNVARYRHDRAWMRAWGEELRLLDPRAERVVSVHEALANDAIFALDWSGARREMDAALAARAPATLVGAFVLADLVRVEGRSEDLERVEAALSARAAEHEDPPTQLLVRHIRALAGLRRARAESLAALRSIMTDARALEGDATARSAAAYSASLLALEAGEDGKFDRVIHTIVEEQNLEVSPRCVVALETHLERSVIAARDAQGVPFGVMLRGEQRAVVPGTTSLITARLAACEQVLVMARPALHGKSGMFDPSLAYSFAVDAPPPRADVRAEVSRDRSPDVLYVYGATPPASAGLAPLAPIPAELTRDAMVITADRATPVEVLMFIGFVGWAELHAHGVLYGDSDSAALALSPDADGKYRLFAEDVERMRFERAAVVVLAACDSADVQREDLLEPSGLPVAFLRAGARAVIASDAPLPDADAAAFFRDVRLRVEQGAPIAVALRDSRTARPVSERDWTHSVVVFEGGRSN